MTKDERNLLELLKEELSFIEMGGYGRSVRTPWKSTSTFQDSLTCINFGDPSRAHPCDECHLLEFVPEDDRDRNVPCHHIELSNERETIADLEARDNQQKLEEHVKSWLKERIKELEEKSAAE